MAQFKKLGVAGGGGSSASVVLPGGWSGTVVPNTGSIENVYWNTSMSMDEINEMLTNANLTYITYEDMPVYGACAALNADGDPVSLVGIVNLSSMLGGLPAYFGIDMVGETFLFCTSELLATQMECPFGWNPDLVAINGVIPLNATLIPSLAEGLVFDSIGAENDKLSTLFSSSPIVKSKGESIFLEGEYDGDKVALPHNEAIDVKALLDNKKLPLFIDLYENGAIVPNSGYIEKVYINTALSPDEVKNIFDSITQWEFISESSAGESLYVYGVLEGANDYPGITLTKIVASNIVMYIISVSPFKGSTNLIFLYDGGASTGWIDNPMNTLAVFGDVIDTGKYVDSEKMFAVGLENNKLTRLFSITPFLSTTASNILDNYTVPLTGVIPSNAYKGLPTYSITLADGVMSISDYAFADCIHLKNINFPSSLTSIHSSAFKNADSLTSINIPNTLTYLAEYAFQDCSGLSVINYDGTVSDWVNLCSTGRPLFRANRHGINLYLNNELLTHLICPVDMTEFGSQFSGCGSIVEITIPNGAETIPQYAFIYCPNLKTVNIPISVLEIHPGAFQDCDSMEVINYSGTKEQWKAITKYGDWDWNTSTYVVVCTDGTIARDGTET